MEIIYRANDGNEFTNEKDCLNHEEKIAEEYDFSNIVMLDKEMEVLKTNTKDDILNAIDYVCYFSVETEKDYNKIVNLLKKAGYYDILPEYDKKYEGKQAIYVYDYEYGGTDEWVNFNEFCEKITENIVKIRQRFF